MKTSSVRGGILVVLSAAYCVLVAGCDPLQRAAAPTAAAPTIPPAAATSAPAVTPLAAGYTAKSVPVAVAYAQGWTASESANRLLLAAGPAALAGAELEGPALVVCRVEGVTVPEDLLKRVSLEGAEIIRRGDARLGGEVGRLVEATVTSPVGGRGYRLLVIAVAHGGHGYLVTASAPLERWEAAQAELQRMIESIAFR